MLVPSDDPEFIKFVTQIIADPADDTTRLVFADWLADRGDPRAPLLRVVPLVRQAAGPVETVPKLKRARRRWAAARHAARRECGRPSGRSACVSDRTS
jgi:uncharacterized protein (TIGR02996 family)